MNKKLFGSLCIQFILLLLCILPQNVVAQNRKFTRPTVVAVPLSEAPFYHVKMAFEDDEYFFAHRHYGRAQYTPGFFVYGKKQKKWVEIKQLSTEHAKLGRYFPFLPAGKHDEKTGMSELIRNPKLPMLAITWDYTSLRNVEYADFPLHTSGSIHFPDKITFDRDAKTYRFYFHSGYNIEEMMSQFWVRKADLRKVFR